MVRYERDVVTIEAPGIDKQRVSLNVIDQVIVHGNPFLHAAFLRAAAEKSVPVTCLNSRGKGKDAQLGSGLASQLPIRRLQFRCAFNEASTLAMARWIIKEKLLSYPLSVGALPTANEPLQIFQQRLTQALLNVESAQSIDELMGYEGAQANAWFGLIAATLDGSWQFKGRNRQPPRDPLNALLSLGYTLLGGVVRQVVVGEGLDPAQGFLHQDYPGREALVLDLVEAFRAGVDLFSLQLLDDLDPDDFSNSVSQGCRLLKDARPMFYEGWARAIEEWPRLDNAGECQAGSPLCDQVRGKLMAMRAQMKSLAE